MGKKGGKAFVNHKAGSDNSKKPGKSHQQPSHQQQHQHKKKAKPPASAIGRFVVWAGQHLSVNPRVRVTSDAREVAAGYGMIASGNVEDGEVLFSIPRSMVLSPLTCSIAEILHPLLESLGSKVPRPGSEEEDDDDDDLIRV
eukprot:m.45122 g.45122  ORF g.45122 m.45122 type:complete len:142 (+) comp12408_c0_seq2:163-588(+)